MQSVKISDAISLDNSQPFVLMGGMNVLESRDMAMTVADHYVKVTQKLGIPYVFKASFDKANRSSVDSFRGPGLEQGLKWLQEIKQTFGVPIISDIHEPHQAKAAAEVLDIIQVPAFLARQTDLIVAVAETQKPVNVKKPQFLTAKEMQHIISKLNQAGNDQVMLCERGSQFGYNNLVVDMLAMDEMKAYAPVVFDVTHALQRPGGRADSADGRRAQVTALARSGMALGLAGLFLEAHPDPSKAKCDGPCALPLDQLEPFLQQVQAIDQLVKSFSAVETG